MRAAKIVHELVELRCSHDVAQLGQDEHPFSRRDVVPFVGAEVGVDLGQGDVMAATAGDGRQVTRGRREQRQGQPLAVADTQLAARGVGP